MLPGSYFISTARPIQPVSSEKHDSSNDTFGEVVLWIPVNQGNIWRSPEEVVGQLLLAHGFKPSPASSTGEEAAFHPQCLKNSVFAAH